MAGRDYGTTPGREDTWGYDEDDVEWFERFTLRPAPPSTIEERLASGESLETLDLPAHLSRELVVEPETGVALYRLVELFGTPNVPWGVAGATQRDRYATTWQYLFTVEYERDDDEPDRPEQFLMSIYDFQTGVSTGLSAWRDDGEGDLDDPVKHADECSAVETYDQEFHEGLVQLALNTVEEPVPSTFEEVWV